MELNVQKDIQLKPFNTFGVKAVAKEFVEVRTLEDLKAVSAYLIAHPELNYLILGGGSDVLFSRDFDGLVILNRLCGMRATGETDDHYLVRCASGEVWHTLVMRTLDANKPGLENLALVPGTVGGAPIQNIGAYGLEVAELIDSVECFDLKSGESKTFTAEECDFGYRSSIFKMPENKSLFITAVNFKIPRKWAAKIEYKDLEQELLAYRLPNPMPGDVYSAVVAIRSRKLPDPNKLGNAGSFFKNPIVDREQFNELQVKHPSIPYYPLAGGRYKLSAAWLIDNTGLKGIRLGDVGVYYKQPLVIVNYGHASGEDVFAMAQDVKFRVKNSFGIRLQPEVVIV